MRKIYFLIVFVLSINAASSQLLQWNTFGNTGTETTEPSVSNDANISSSNLTLGAGIASAGNANRFGGSGWFDTGNTNPSTLSEAVSGNSYIEFIVTPNAGFSFTPTSFVFNWDKSGAGPQNVALRSSVDGFVADLGIVAPTAAIATQNTITISGLTALTTATTFRVYGYGATATSGTGGFDIGTNVINVRLNGSTASTGGGAIAPSVSSATVSSITTSSAILGGTINSDGGDAISERGIVWSASNTDPLIGGTDVTKIAEGGTAVSAFTTSAGSLPSGTLIYYKAYGTNSQGTGYTAVSSFSTLSEEPTNHVTGFACGTTQSSSIPLSWTDATGTTIPVGYLVKWSSVSFADISDPIDGVPESNGAGRLNVAAGTQAVDITGLTQVTTYYFKIFPYTNTGSSIDFKTDGVVPSTSCITLSGPWEDFETGTKTGYTIGSVTFTAGSWTMDDALLGTSASDAKNGTKSVRIRNGSLTMDFDVTTGIGILRLYHAKFGTDADGTWQLEASTDGGTTWTAYVSSPITSSLTTLTQQSFNLNLQGNVRVRVVKTDGGSNRINIDDITFTLPAPLPVKFTNVRAYQQGNGIKVEWSNQTETDVVSYHVERSATGQGFTSLSDISASKNDGSRADYAFYDALPVNGTNFYRIQSVEADGKKLYSAVVRVNTKGGKTEISLYPNPVTAGQLSMQATDLKQGLYTLHIFNAAGQQVYTQQLIHAGGAVTETVQLPALLKSGLYSLQVRNAEINLSKLFIIR